MLAIQKPLYYFLRLGFKFAETDEYFANIVDIWISFITPWSNHAKKQPVTIAGARTPPVPGLAISTLDVTQEW
ncbi:UNVERIFIED_CONTAM: hypothetical protein HDU68_011895 [Siphonaria sp. JEL0065]|nr:hypothetical protein HDU68_011895 [Siphonaria sp. JEL0065]